MLTPVAAALSGRHLVDRLDTAIGSHYADSGTCSGYALEAVQDTKSVTPHLVTCTCCSGEATDELEELLCSSPSSSSSSPSSLCKPGTCCARQIQINDLNLFGSSIIQVDDKISVNK